MIVLSMLLGLLVSVLQSPPATSQAIPTEPIPRAELETMYQHELGGLYKPANYEKLFAAHQLIERYFADDSVGERARIVQQLDASGIDPNILGRITRIRLNWPALAGGVYYINERYGPHQVHYFIGIPKNYDRARSWPLLIKLPTADAFVNEPKPNADQVTEIYSKWMTEELTKHPDAIVIMPLLNLDELWGPSYGGMNNVIQPMLHAAGRANIDPARVYLLGHSMSGHAVWNIALHYPTYFAAVAPLAAAASNDWQRLRMMNLKNVLPVVWHDASDKLVPVKQARDIMTVLKRIKVDVQYEESKDVGHVPTDEIVERLYQRLRAKVRELYPAQISLQSNRPETIFNRSDWLQIYQPLSAGEEKKLQFKQVAGFMLVNSKTWSATATLSANNHIDITADNVEILRLYVNDQMIDFNKVVTVVVNKKGRFEARVRPSIDEMLKDQLFLGRGWRYFSGVIDVDLARSAAGASGESTTQAATKPRQ
jgi:hypothetical protein